MLAYRGPLVHWGLLLYLSLECVHDQFDPDSSATIQDTVTSLEVTHQELYKFALSNTIHGLWSIDRDTALNFCVGFDRLRENICETHRALG